MILLSNLGLGLDYIVMALAPTLGWLFAGRLLSGITSANDPGRSSMAWGTTSTSRAVNPASASARRVPASSFVRTTAPPAPRPVTPASDVMLMPLSALLSSVYGRFKDSVDMANLKSAAVAPASPSPP